MAIQSSDLALRKAESDTDLTSNGGYMKSSVESITASLFPDVSSTERDAGVTRYRKVFFHNSESNGSQPNNKYVDQTLLSPKVYLASISPAGDTFLMRAGTAIDTQTAAAGYTGWSGVGYLNADASIGATTLYVRSEMNGSAGEIFQNGVAILSKLTNGVLSREFVTISGTSWGIGADANLCTLTISGTPLASLWSRAADTVTCDTGNTDATHIGQAGNTYTTNAMVGKRVRIKTGTGAGQMRRIIGNTITKLEVEYAWSTLPIGGDSQYEILDTIVSMCVPLSDIVASYNTVSVTSAGGSFTATSNLKVYPAGTLDDRWTILFNTADTFTVTGTHYTGLTLPTGNRNTLYRATVGTQYLFEIAVAAWGGTFIAGDKVEFNTVSSTKSFWVKQIVPPDTLPHYANAWDIGATGDTV